MKEFVMFIDPFVMDQQIYECKEGHFLPVATFQLQSIATYVPFLQLLEEIGKDNEQITLNLRCPKAFKEKIQNTIYTYLGKMNYNLDNIIIKEI